MATQAPVVECEMGNFAQVIAEYKDMKGGTISYSGPNYV